MLPEEFQFSQVSLQDFVDCRRRFQLRYLERVRWPAIESEPVEEQERRMRRGADFHRMVQQSLLGIPESRLSASIEDPELAGLWQNYLDYRPIAQAVGSQPYQTYPEVTLMTTLTGHRILAKYDVVVSTEKGRIVIFDWKTSERWYDAGEMEPRLQTRVYRSVMVRAGDRLNDGRPVSPTRLEMVYWFVRHPHRPVRLPYSERAYDEDVGDLRDLIARIESASETGAFPKTEDRNRCRYCVYRSYCDRGTEAGALDEEAVSLDLLEPDEAEPETGFDFDFDQIAEVEF